MSELTGVSRGAPLLLRSVGLSFPLESLLGSLCDVVNRHFNRRTTPSGVLLSLSVSGHLTVFSDTSLIKLQG